MTPAVIGGGISGLALAHDLRARGMKPLVLEQSGRVGGTVRSVEERGLLTEDGPNSFLDRDLSVRRLVRSLGIEHQLLAASPAARRRYVYSRGRLWRVSPIGVLFSGLLSVPGRLRLLLEPFSRRGPGQDESLASFARRHLGREATEVLVDAVQAGIFAGDVERLSAQTAFPRLAELERAHRSLVVGAWRNAAARSDSSMLTFARGLEVLVQALAKSLGPAVRTGVEVRALERTASGWRVDLGEGGKLEADQVALAVPASAAARLVEPLDASLAQALVEIPYVPVAVVHLGFAREALPPPDGFGFLVPKLEGRGLLGAIHVTTIFPWRAPGGEVLVTCMMGGARAPELVSLPEPELVEQARKELSELAGIEAAPIYQRVIRWPRAIPQYEVGHGERLRRIDEALKSWPGLFLTGNALKGPGLADCVRNAGTLAEEMRRAALS